MEDKYQNKYRIASARWEQWNYGWDAAYFITICTKDRLHHFGEITNGKMSLTAAGVLADVFWHEIKNHAHHIGLGAFVVMPNHIHGILILDGNGGNVDGNMKNNGARNDIAGNVNDDTKNENNANDENVNDNNVPIQPSPTNTPGQNRFQNQGKNTISSIVGGYKSAVTKHANRMGLEMGWQALFHDHVIRDEPSFVRITEYINNNPRNWSDDRFFN